jgi:hypothetical protein
MIKKRPTIGRLVRLPSRIVTIMGFEDGFFRVRTGVKKIEKVTEEMLMEHGTLVPRQWHEEKKIAPKQEYVNLEFKRFFDERQEQAYQEKILKGYVIEDEVIEDFVAIAEE